MSQADPVNRYSRAWSETFLEGFDPAQTARELKFLQRQLPLPKFRRVLDICCGAGRHAAALCGAGYEVVGVERDPVLVDLARRAAPQATIHEFDVRYLDRLDGVFDAATCMWQSFGYFDSANNDALLRSIASKLADDGRLVLDIYHRDFFEARQGTRESIVRGRSVVETKRVFDGRLHVHLSYDDDDGAASDDFEWELFTPDSLSKRAEQARLSLESAFTNFDESQSASGLSPRMQLIFTKRR